MEIPTELPIAVPHTNAELQGNLLQDYEHKFEQLPEHQKLSNLCSDLGSKIFEKGHFFITLDGEEGPDEMKETVESTRYFGGEEASRVTRVDSRNYENRPRPGCEGSAFSQERYGTEMLIESLFRDGTAFMGSYRERN